MDNEKEISFGAFDSELMRQEITIPEGFEATIDGNKIILKKIESEDERIRKELIEHVKDQQSSFISAPDCRDKYEEEENNKYNSWLSWLEKQGNIGNLTDKDMKEALRTEYEKGRADAFAEMQKEWSEEDEIMIANIRDDLFCYQTKVRDEDHQLAEDIEKEIKWLKPLKDRYTWKPSDAQIRALEYIIDNAHNTSYSCKIAKELLEQLKKLKGE